MTGTERALWIALLCVAGTACAEEPSYKDELIYLPDEAATEAVRKGERRAKRIQQRRSERGKAGIVPVATSRNRPLGISATLPGEKSAAKSKRGSFTQAVKDSLANTSLSFYPVLTKKHIGIGIRIVSGDENADGAMWDSDFMSDFESVNAKQNALARRDKARGQRKYFKSNSDPRKRR